jgi:hypothetical protein
MTAMDPTRQAWFDRARAHPVEGILQKRGFKLPSGTKNERKGPCPRCGGDDRFGLSISKQTFTCHQCGLKGAGGIDIIVEIGEAKTPWEAAEILEGPPPKPNGHDTGTTKSRHIATWIYRDADGKPFLKVDRYDKPDGGKSYPQARWEDGKWVSGKPAGVKIPYRLPELLDSDRTEPIWITEGEKCADAVAGLGLTATSASEGAGKWTTDLNEWFRDRTAYILPDNDEPGTKHAEQIAHSLGGIAREIRIVSLSGLAIGDDVYDWIWRGGTREQLDELGDAAPKWQEGGIHQNPDGTMGEKPEKGDTDVVFKLVSFDDLIAPSADEYNVKGLFPRRGLVLVWGPPKCGKSFWVFDVTMHVALGREYRGRKVKQGEAVYLALEGQAGFPKRRDAFRKSFLQPDQKVPLFKLCGATLDLIKDHKKLIADIKEQSAKPAIVVVDTLNRSLVGSESSDEDMAAYLQAANAIEAAFACLVVVIHHCGVNESRPRGHTSMTGAADVQISVKKDDAGNVLATVDLAKDMPEGATFASRLQVVELGTDRDGDEITSCVCKLVPDSPDTPKAQGKAQAKLNANQQRFVDILRIAIIEAPADHKDTTTVPNGARAVTRDMLKKYCVARGWLEEGESNKARATLSNMINALAGKRVIGTTDVHVWIA